MVEETDVQTCTIMLADSDVVPASIDSLGNCDKPWPMLTNLANNMSSHLKNMKYFSTDFQQSSDSVDGPVYVPDECCMHSDEEQSANNDAACSFSVDDGKPGPIVPRQAEVDTVETVTNNSEQYRQKQLSSSSHKKQTSSFTSMSNCQLNSDHQKCDSHDVESDDSVVDLIYVPDECMVLNEVQFATDDAAPSVFVDHKPRLTVVRDVEMVAVETAANDIEQHHHEKLSSSSHKKESASLTLLSNSQLNSGCQKFVSSNIESSDSVGDPVYVPDDCSMSGDEEQCATNDTPAISADGGKLVPIVSRQTEVDAVKTVMIDSEEHSQKPLRSGMKHTGSLTLLSKRQPRTGCKKSYDKIHYCLFCKKAISSKMSRHLVKVHKDEERVQKSLSLPKGSKERVHLLQMLTNEGNFEHNIAVMSQGIGQIVVGRRSAGERQVSHYTVCSFCKKWETKRNLWRHSQKCPARIQYFQHDKTVRKKRLLAVKSGQSLITKSVCEPDDDVDRTYNTNEG